MLTILSPSICSYIVYVSCPTTCYPLGDPPDLQPHRLHPFPLSLSLTSAPFVLPETFNEQSLQSNVQLEAALLYDLRFRYRKRFGRSKINTGLLLNSLEISTAGRSVLLLAVYGINGNGMWFPFYCHSLPIGVVRFSFIIGGARYFARGNCCF